MASVDSRVGIQKNFYELKLVRQTQFKIFERLNTQQSFSEKVCDLNRRNSSKTSSLKVFASFFILEHWRFVLTTLSENLKRKFSFSNTKFQARSNTLLIET